MGRWIVMGIVIFVVIGGLYSWRWYKVSQRAELIESYALPPFEGGFLAKNIDQLGQGEAGESGFFPLNRSLDALSWRLALIDSAERSLDAQYYLWHSDTSGGLLLDRVIKAADRGVRVRLLIDDMTAKHDKALATIHEHPNIEIRIFNPGLRRDSAIGRALEMVFHVGRMNHRMHNKLLVADNLLGIVGGRNIGDEYFGLSKEKLNFRDFDLLALGPVVPEMSSSFDLYWNSEMAFPISTIRSIDTTAEELAALQTQLSHTLQKAEVLAAEGWLIPKSWTEELRSLNGRLFWGEAKVIYDIPSLDKKDVTLTHMAKQLGQVARETQDELLFCSAYFVPRDAGTKSLQDTAGRGVKIRILTNSLAATDVVPVHSGYAPYRKDLLQAGIELYEFRPDGKDRRIHEHPSAKAERFGLHTKSVIYDRTVVYVGSLNLDPRAIELNTEIGVLVHAPELAETMIAMFERDLLPENSWQVQLDRDEKLVWHSDGEPTRREPAHRFFDRILHAVCNLLPIEGLL